MVKLYTAVPFPVDFFTHTAEVEKFTEKNIAEKATAVYILVESQTSAEVLISRINIS